MKVSMPDLISFAIYDGIPPQEEGMDPTVFWYWPKQTQKDVQLNEIGLYLTFTGFCRDFRASKDCQFVQTDTAFTCFGTLGSDVNVAACFNSTDPKYHRILVNSLEAFISVYFMFFSAPTRQKDGSLDRTSTFTFNEYVEELLNIFNCFPFIKRLPPSLSTWMMCEEILASAKNVLPIIKSAAFIYKDYLVHTCMKPKNFLALYLAYQAKIKALLDFAPINPPKNKFYWQLGVVGDPERPVVYFTSLNLLDTSVYTAIVSYNELTIFILLSTPKEIVPSAFLPLQNVLEQIMPNIEQECISILNHETIQKVPIYRDDGIFILQREKQKVLKSSKQNNQHPQNSQNALNEKFSETEYILEFLNETESEFIRVCAQTTPSSYIFMQKDGNQSTITSGQSESMADATSQFVEFLKSSKLG
ncbi:hypothetical protein TRFO_30598 [Tritrichomonas foetus]|uniref:CCZ1/INTU/HSP4 first Longin domain-containing protein n=1 Tax=Tritrichomonas foetus TaxID=1144522 RepID=A0A1J4JXM6_9EUKA|nr:hypothetical protein TRFO_30598 [Tritrichomonas foetus]|eukprot:OHT02284.1 hypothetical protein TRFO_30598 [Tritrichomonas foetus]